MTRISHAGSHAIPGPHFSVRGISSAEHCWAFFEGNQLFLGDLGMRLLHRMPTRGQRALALGRHPRELFFLDGDIYSIQLDSNDVQLVAQCESAAHSAFPEATGGLSTAQFAWTLQYDSGQRELITQIVAGNCAAV